MLQKEIRPFGVLVCLLMLVTLEMPAQVSYTKIVAYDGSTGDHFGRSVAMDGDYVVIGALQDDNESGSVYVFRSEGGSWVFESKLVAGDRSPGSRFGRSVAVSGGTIAVGADRESSDEQNEGSVYVFQKTGPDWVQTAKLRPATTRAGDNFGTCIALSGAFMAVGVPRSNGTGNNSGSVVLYELDGTGWVYHSTLTASDEAAFDEFGYSCSMEGDDLLVGAWKREGGRGGAYVFRRSGDSWLEEAILEADDGSPGDHFGSWWLSISGGRAALGALDDDDLGLNSGSAYIFLRDETGWSQEAKLLPADGQAGDGFGVAASLSGDYVLVGAWEGAGTGAAYLFRAENGEWTEIQRLVPDDIQAGDEFGYALCLTGDMAVVGCDDDIVNSQRRGSAFILNGLTGTIQTLSARIWSDAGPVIIPPGGGTAPYSISVTNNSAQTQSMDVWVDMLLPTGTSRIIFGPRPKTIQAGSQIGANKTVTLLADDPPGEYLLVLNAGSFGGSTTASDTLPATKLAGGPAAMSPGERASPRPGIESVYPNPFNPSAAITYSVSGDGPVSLMVFSTDGQVVRTLVDEYQPAGRRSVVWDGTDNWGNSVSGGIYFVRLRTPVFQGTQKVLLLK